MRERNSFSEDLVHPVVWPEAHLCPQSAAPRPEEGP